MRVAFSVRPTDYVRCCDKESRSRSGRRVQSVSRQPSKNKPLGRSSGPRIVCCELWERGGSLRTSKRFASLQIAVSQETARPRNSQPVVPVVGVGQRRSRRLRCMQHLGIALVMGTG